MAKNVTDALMFIGGGSNYSATDQDAWSPLPCPTCNASMMVKIAFSLNAPHEWLRCPSCLSPAVARLGVVYPSTLPLRAPEGLPSLDSALWAEIRLCLGSGASTAAVMLCRKLLFHVAVAHGLPPKKENGWAPSFAECAAHLEREGVITAAMRPWVDKVKDVGNEVNHEIQPVSPDQALKVATFTLQLLVLAYEVQAQLTGAMGPAADSPDEASTGGSSSTEH